MAAAAIARVEASHRCGSTCVSRREGEGAQSAGVPCVDVPWVNVLGVDKYCCPHEVAAWGGTRV
eukprot:119908-Chlamydomonas_euryale.AAC.2